jgi:hypothetical protein
MLEKINQHRRHFMGTAAMTIAATPFMLGSADAKPSIVKSDGVPPVRPGANISFDSLNQIDAGVLNIGYAETGPADGPAVILLHGWPYDIYSFVDVTPLLASRGYSAQNPESNRCRL